MRTTAVIVAGGVGRRMGLKKPKQFEALGGKPMLRWCVEAFAQAPAVTDIIVVADPSMREDILAACVGSAVRLAPAGATRIGSVRAGVAAASDAEALLVHDAARPGVRPTHVSALLEALSKHDAVAPMLPGADALKRLDDQGAVLSEVDRAGLVRVQTPQALRAAPYRRALEAVPDDAPFDDDLALARAAGLSCALIPGDHRLMKATYPEDLALLERLLTLMTPATGSGFDAHRFGPGDHVTLCGVRIPHSHGLVGHSDADVGWHALTDAIFGALGEGDIGDHFPPSDETWRGADSALFLAHAVALAADRGAKLVHADVTLICERPKIKPHREAMRQRTAEVLGLPLARVSVKATTTEGMGFTGRGEGLAAQAVCTLLLGG